MKILMVSSKVRTYALGFQNCLEPLMSLGHDVLWAADFSGFAGDPGEVPCERVPIDIRRNPLDTNNLRAYKQLLRLIRDKHIDAIYCATPIGGLLGRIAGWRTGVRPVIYAAHGFLFYMGAPWWWNFVFRTEEKILARLTDVLITINDEDMAAAQSFKLRCPGHIYQIGAAGVKEHYEVGKDRAQMRRELGLPDEAIVLVSAGALNKNKNYGPVISAMAILKNEDLYYLICGDGELKQALQKQIQKKGLEGHIMLLGYRTDAIDIMGCADIFVMPSLREGIPRATLEAMALGLPCVVSDSRGNRDLIRHGENGYICAARSAEQYADAISALADDAELRRAMGAKNASGGGYFPVYIVSCSSSVIWHFCRGTWEGERQ